MKRYSDIKKVLIIVLLVLSTSSIGFASYREDASNMINGYWLTTTGSVYHITSDSAKVNYVYLLNDTECIVEIVSKSGVKEMIYIETGEDGNFHMDIADKNNVEICRNLIKTK